MYIIKQSPILVNTSSALNDASFFFVFHRFNSFCTSFSQIMLLILVQPASHVDLLLKPSPWIIPSHTESNDNQQNLTSITSVFLYRQDGKSVPFKSVRCLKEFHAICIVLFVRSITFSSPPALSFLQ